jgi:hypothetical protein
MAGGLAACGPASGIRTWSSSGRSSSPPPSTTTSSGWSRRSRRSTRASPSAGWTSRSRASRRSSCLHRQRPRAGRRQPPRRLRPEATSPSARSAPSTTLLSRDVVDSYFPSARDAARLRASTYGLPWYLSTQILIYDRAGSRPPGSTGLHARDLLRAARLLAPLRRADGGLRLLLPRRRGQLPVRDPGVRGHLDGLTRTARAPRSTRPGAAPDRGVGGHVPLRA